MKIITKKLTVLLLSVSVITTVSAMEMDIRQEDNTSNVRNERIVNREEELMLKFCQGQNLNKEEDEIFNDMINKASSQMEVENDWLNVPM